MLSIYTLPFRISVIRSVSDVQNLYARNAWDLPAVVYRTVTVQYR